MLQRVGVAGDVAAHCVARVASVVVAVLVVGILILEGVVEVFVIGPLGDADAVGFKVDDLLVEAWLLEDTLVHQGAGAIRRARIQDLALVITVMDAVVDQILLSILQPGLLVQMLVRTKFTSVLLDDGERLLLLNRLYLLAVLTDEGSGLRVASLSHESLLCLLLGIIVRAFHELVGGDGLTLRLLHCFVLVLQALLLHFLRLLEELIFSRLVHDDAALMVLVERVLLLTLVGNLI